MSSVKSVDITKTFQREHGCTEKCVEDWIDLNSPLDNIPKEGVIDYSVQKQSVGIP